jgi:hypothetical protein
MHYMHSYARNCLDRLYQKAKDGYESILMHLVDQEFQSHKKWLQFLGTLHNKISNRKLCEHHSIFKFLSQYQYCNDNEYMSINKLTY